MGQFQSHGGGFEDGDRLLKQADPIFALGE
jgi:hypothetical protein